MMVHIDFIIPYGIDTNEPTLKKEWPSVPRVGDYVDFCEYKRSCRMKVREVNWVDGGLGTTFAQVFLEKIPY